MYVYVYMHICICIYIYIYMFQPLEPRGRAAGGDRAGGPGAKKNNNKV